MPTLEPATVSVVVPCYNYGRFLRAAVRSLLDQPGVNLDVLVIDDASTDETPAVAAALAADDSRVHVVRHQTNAGHIATFNQGLAAATGEFVVKLDADDMLTPGSLQRAVALLQNCPSVDLVYGRPVHFSVSPPPQARQTPSSWVIWSPVAWVAKRCRRGVNCISNPEAVVRASALREVGLYNPTLPHTFDFEMWLKLAARGEVGWIAGADQAYYRVHAASFQRTIHAGILMDLQGRRDAFAAFFTGIGDTLPGVDSLYADARRSMATDALDRACQAYDRGRTATVPVDDLVDFAIAVWPDSPLMPQWRALARRRAVGPQLAPMMPPFLARAVIRRVSAELYARRWLRSGV